MAQDYYETLGVERNATVTEIKKAYRRLAQAHHPDKHKGEKHAEEKFKEINEAYQVLKDQEKRARYDRFGEAGLGGPGQDPGGPGMGGDFQDLFGDIFSDFFGGRQRRPGPERGGDLRYDLQIDFDDAVFGATKDIEIPKTVKCKKCKGSGAKPGTSPKRCARCGGGGQETIQQGLFHIQRPCSGCRGRGTIIESPCPECRSAGKVNITKTLSINMPPGVDTGSRLRVSGEGEAGVRGGPPGDLYVFLTVTKHPIFSRREAEIICEVPISFPQATLGAEIEVPTIEGTVKLKIPPGTQTGKIFRLKQKGVVILGSSRRGDQHVVVKIETPTKLNKKQREVLEEFAAITGDDVFPMKNTFFSKVKELFE